MPQLGKVTSLFQVHSNRGLFEGYSKVTKIRALAEPSRAI